ncbi:MAG: CPBP family intramembrane metalloprotease, partial [Candidatus Hydrogenedentes bacterium]|nr:CPBP family intramembrane metalloprotease [Candidatus Hydrogenedentota bacterium]
MIEHKGIAAFLLLTFGLTFAYEGCLIATGLSVNLGLSPDTPAPPAYVALLIGLVMWVPTLSTFIVVKFITKEGFASTMLRLGPLKPFLASALIIPACFLIIYALTWLLGLGAPDWRLEHVRRTAASFGIDTATMPDSRILLPLIFVASLALGPTVNGVFGFGEELGWRGYLLPKLMPLGKWRAYIVLGMIWGFWHAPLILAGLNYPGYPILGVVAMMGMTTTLGIYINEMTLRYRSAILAG